MKSALILTFAAVLIVSQNVSAQSGGGNWPDGRFGSGQGNGGPYFGSSAPMAAPASRVPFVPKGAEVKEHNALAEKFIRVHGAKEWHAFGKFKSLADLRSAVRYLSVPAMIGAAVGSGASSEAQAASVRFDPNTGTSSTPISLDTSNVGARNSVLSQSENTVRRSDSKGLATSR